MSVRTHEPLPAAPAVLQDREAGRGLAGLRLVRLHLISRRVPATLVALAACAVVLRVELQQHWLSGGLELPLLIEAGAAALVAVACGSPFGDPERATGRWLPWLRLGAALGLTATAFGVLAIGAAAAHLPGGYLAVLRNVAGITGIGLLSAVRRRRPCLGRSHGLRGARRGRTARRMEDALDVASAEVREPRAAICASLVFVAGILYTTVRGARDSIGE